MGDGCAFAALPLGNATITSGAVSALEDGRFRATFGGAGLSLVNATLDAAGVSCVVESSSATSFTCVFPSGGEAGVHELRLRVPGYGFAAYSGEVGAVVQV